MEKISIDFVLAIRCPMRSSWDRPRAMLSAKLLRSSELITQRQLLTIARECNAEGFPMSSGDSDMLLQMAEPLRARHD